LEEAIDLSGDRQILDEKSMQEESRLYKFWSELIVGDVLLIAFLCRKFCAAISEIIFVVNSGHLHYLSDLRGENHFLLPFLITFSHS
jgi:hypothetical protein